MRGTELRVHCEACGAPLPAGAKFCLECGRQVERRSASRSSPLPPSGEPALAGEYKQVSVVFCDIVRSSALARELGDEGLHRLVADFLTAARDEVGRYQGTINQFLGDGFMALFGAPVAYEDHARRAVLAALAIRDRARVEVRIGINSGSVVVGSIGENVRDYSAFGETTILAARLQAAATPGEVLVSERTASLVRGYFELAAAEPVVVKERAVRPLRVTGVGTRSSRVDGSTGAQLTPFVGRAGELATLRDLLAAARAGEGRVAAVTGEPGLGKSRLVFELRREVERAATFVEGRCLPYGTSIPYLPVLDLVRALCAIDAGDDGTRIAAKVAATLERLDDGARHVPYLVRLLEPGGGDPQLAELDPATIRGRTTAAFRELVLGESRRAPLVVVLEDLHWIDRTSDELLSGLIAAVAGERLAVIATYRPGYDAPWLAAPFVTRLSLRPVGTRESNEIVRAVLGGAAEPRAHAIVERGEGNPFFLEELARAAREPGGADSSVPGTVQEVLAARIDRLDRAAKRAIQVASVLGREFALELVRPVWDGEGDVARQLHELTRLGFLRERRDGDGRVFAFEHALTQEVAYESLLVSRRQELHARAGAAIERLRAGRLDEHVELLAHHYGRSSDLERAAHYFELASRRAASQNAMEEAVAYFYAALSVLEQLPDSPEVRRRRVALVLDQTGDFHFLERHREYYGLILRHEPLVAELGDESLLGAFYARLGHRQWTAWETDDARRSLTLAAELCERSGNDVDAAAAYALLAWTSFAAGDFERAPRYSERALEKLARSFHPVWYNLARCGACLGYMPRGRFDDAIREAEAAIELGRARSDTAIASFNGSFLAVVTFYRRDYARALEAAAASFECAPTVFFRGLPQAIRAASLCHVGSAAEGVAILDALWPVPPIARESEQWFPTMAIALLRGDALLAAGDRRRAAAGLAGTVAEADPRGGPFLAAEAHRLLAECTLDLDEDRTAETAAHLDRAIELSEATGMENELALALADRGRLLRRLGQEDEGRATLEQALAILERIGTLEEPERVRLELATGL